MQISSLWHPPLKTLSPLAFLDSQLYLFYSGRSRGSSCILLSLCGSLETLAGAIIGITICFSPLRDDRAVGYPMSENYYLLYFICFFKRSFRLEGKYSPGFYIFAKVNILLTFNRRFFNFNKLRKKNFKC